MNYHQILGFLQMTNLSANALHNDLLKINNWAYQWKMSFNPFHFKPAQEVFFFIKLRNQANRC